MDEHARDVTIALEGLEVRCRCGVTDEERREAQTLLVDVRLSPLAHDYRDDDLAQTVDYAAVAELVAVTAGEREYKLIERLATEVADRLWAAGDLRRLSVAVRKPSPPVGAPATAACAEVVYSR